jgi:hypothetical protein
MEHLPAADATYHAYNDRAIEVNEFNFKGSEAANDAEIVIAGRYPSEGYAVNDISTALVSVESGEGAITIKGEEPTDLRPGDRLLIHPGEPYCFTALGQLAIRYVAMPAWLAKQSRIIK